VSAVAKSVRSLLLFLSCTVGGTYGSATEGRAESWTVPGFYSVKVDGWTRSSVTQADATYDCQRCDSRVFITVGIGPPNEPATGWTSNDSFMASLGSDQRRRDFAKLYMDGWARRGIPYEMVNVGLGPIDNLHALQFSCRLKQGTKVIYMTHLQAVHKGRFLRINVLAEQPGMTQKSRASVDAFMDGLKLEK
jgi:hypothetical protein